MKIIKKDKKSIELVGKEKHGTSYKLVLLDMGDYIGFRDRCWYDNVPVIWTPVNFYMDFDEKSGLEDYSFQSEMLYDDKGKLMRMLISHRNGLMRCCQFYHMNIPPENASEEDIAKRTTYMEKLYGEGFSLERGFGGRFWCQQYITESKDSFYKEKPIYYYKNGQFISEDGKVLENPADLKDLPVVVKDISEKVAYKINHSEDEDDGGGQENSN